MGERKGKKERREKGPTGKTPEIAVTILEQTPRINCILAEYCYSNFGSGKVLALSTVKRKRERKTHLKVVETVRTGIKRHFAVIGRDPEI